MLALRKVLGWKGPLKVLSDNSIKQIPKCLLTQGLSGSQPMTLFEWFCAKAHEKQ